MLLFVDIILSCFSGTFENHYCGNFSNGLHNNLDVDLSNEPKTGSNLNNNYNGHSGVQLSVRGLRHGQGEGRNLRH